MKIYLLDNGSIVIDHAQLMWNIGGGTPVRIPSYGLPQQALHFSDRPTDVCRSWRPPEPRHVAGK